MKKLVAAIVAVMVGTSAYATNMVLIHSGDTVARVGAYAGNSTWEPALEVRIDGVTKVYRIGQMGLSRADVFDHEKAVAWVKRTFGRDVTPLGDVGGGTGTPSGEGEGGGGF